MGKQGLWNGDKILPHCFLCTRVNRANAMLLFNVLDNYYANTWCTARLGNNEKTWSKFQFLVSRYLFTGYDKIWNISFLHRNIFSKSISYLYTSQFQYIEMQKLKTMWKILSIVENINYETTKWMLSNWLFFFLFPFFNGTKATRRIFTVSLKPFRASWAAQYFQGKLVLCS